MQLSRKSGLVIGLVVAAICVVGVAPAQAVIHPDNTFETASSANTQLSYGGIKINCDTATSSGTTGNSTSSLTSTIIFTHTTGSCPTSVSGVTCAQPITVNVTLHVLVSNATGGTGNATIDKVVNLACGAGSDKTQCTYSIAAGQVTTPNNGIVYTNATTVLQVNANFNVTRGGSFGILCGPAAGAGQFTGTFTVKQDLNIV